MAEIELVIATLLNIIQYKGKYLTPAELDVLIDVLHYYRGLAAHKQEGG